MGDYVAGFLGMAEGNAWSMNAFDVCLSSHSFTLCKYADLSRYIISPLHFLTNPSSTAAKATTSVSSSTYSIVYVPSPSSFPHSFAHHKLADSTGLRTSSSLLPSIYACVTVAHDSIRRRREMD